MNTPKSILHQMALDAWSAGAVTFCVCLALEALEPGFVTRFFNPLLLLTFLVAATFAVMATHPGAGEAEAGLRSPRNARALLRLVSLLAAVAAWFLLPASLSQPWRVATTAAILVTALAVWPALSKSE